jgi:hypothetical protein
VPVALPVNAVLAAPLLVMDVFKVDGLSTSVATGFEAATTPSGSAAEAATAAADPAATRSARRERRALGSDVMTVLQAADG